jgi:hypothetical protein
VHQVLEKEGPPATAHIEDGEDGHDGGQPPILHFLSSTKNGTTISFHVNEQSAVVYRGIPLLFFSLIWNWHGGVVCPSVSSFFFFERMIIIPDIYFFPSSHSNSHIKLICFALYF